MKRPSLLTLASALLAIALSTSACSSSADSGTSGGGAGTSGAAPQGAAGGGGGGYGGGGAGGRGGMGRMMGEILVSLNLTDDQKTKIKAIRDAAIAKNKAIPQTDPNRREEARANMTAAYAQIDTILTPAQKTAFHAKMAAMRAKFRQQQGQVQQQPSQQSSP
jgi:Spy/CpxP family protein refolding chaperone